MRGAVLLDNTVLSNFALVKRADLVFALWGARCASTPAVMAEYEAGVTARDLPPDAWQRLKQLEPAPAEVAFARQLSTTLGAGERDCLAIAVQRRGLLASDDADARRVARRHGVPVTGTIGILVLAVRLGHLSPAGANRLLSTLIELGYRSPVLNLDDLISPLEE